MIFQRSNLHIEEDFIMMYKIIVETAVYVEADSKCAKCCIYCDEKSHCEYVCEIVAVEGKDENFIAANCINAYDE